MQSLRLSTADIVSCATTAACCVRPPIPERLRDMAICNGRQAISASSLALEAKEAVALATTVDVQHRSVSRTVIRNTGEPT